MAQWGVDEEGMSTPSYSEVLDYFAQRWEQEFGSEADLSSRSPEGHFFRVIAEDISNKGLPWSDITSLWDAIEDVYNDAFLPTSSGASLDHLVTLRKLIRRGDSPATGTLLFRVEDGEKVPAGTTARTPSGVVFETTRPVVGNRYGVAPVPAEAVEEGNESNVIADTVTQSEVGEVNNPNDTHIYHIGSIVDEWWTIENNENTNNYQLLPVKELKYATNLSAISIKLKSTSAGLYAVKMVIMDSETGEIISRTETREQKLDADTEWDVTFKGEGLDLLKEPISDKVRLAPVNMDYSVDNIKVALENVSSQANWYSGINKHHNDLFAEITSKISGAFTGGRDRETDTELKNRYLNSLSNGGSSRIAAIQAELYSVDTIKHVQILENEKAIDFRPEGLPPNSIEVVVWGGSNEDVLRAILSSRPAGVNTHGSNIGTVKGEFGQVHQIRFSRADEINVHIDIEVVTARTFPASGGEQIKNICAQIVGGEDLNGLFHKGIVGVGDKLYQSELEAKIHNQITGVKSVQTGLGRSDDEIVDSDLNLDDRETPIVKPDNIYITRGS